MRQRGSNVRTECLAGLMDGQGHIPGLVRALLADSLATMSSAVIGSTTATSYLENATGIAEGGRTALTALVLAVLFLLCLFLAPLVACVPPMPRRRCWCW